LSNYKTFIITHKPTGEKFTVKATTPEKALGTLASGEEKKKAFGGQWWTEDCEVKEG